MMNSNMCGADCKDCKEKGGCCGKCCSKVGCIGSVVSKVLVIVGAINWGLVGLGYFVGVRLNVVSMIFGSVPMIEAVVYLLVGVAGFMMIFKCNCAKCKAGMCGSCANGVCAPKEMANEMPKAMPEEKMPMGEMGGEEKI